MWDPTVVAGIVVTFLFILHFREANQRIVILRKRVAYLTRQLQDALTEVKRLEASSREPSGVVFTPSPIEINLEERWKITWAREVLSIQEGPLTPERIRTARRDALKAAHPDAGGSARRMRDVEQAVSFLDTPQKSRTFRM